MGQISAAMAATMPLRAATMSARQRTGDASISTRVNSGQVQVVSVAYPRGRDSRVTVLSEWGTMEQAIAFLNGMGANVAR
jgi:hypothetical protein